MADDEILEKSPSSPDMTGALILSAILLLVATIFMGNWLTLYYDVDNIEVERPALQAYDEPELQKIRSDVNRDLGIREGSKRGKI